MKRDERAVIKTMMRRRCVPSTRELITSAFDYIRLASLQGDFAFSRREEKRRDPRTEACIRRRGGSKAAQTSACPDFRPGFD